MKSSTQKRILKSIWVAIVLMFALTVSTVALWYASVAVEGNVFQTGTVSINLNDGEPVVTKKELLFKPGATLEKEFFIENNSTMDVYYRVYLENATGSAAEVLEVTLKNGDEVLFDGKVAELTREMAEASKNFLHMDETVWLTAVFHMPEEAGNALQKTSLHFDVCVDAVQTKNNPDRLFE